MVAVAAGSGDVAACGGHDHDDDDEDDCGDDVHVLGDAGGVGGNGWDAEHENGPCYCWQW